jgi:hypothetical protein
MSSEEVKWIKDAQRQFKQLFDKPLPIDFRKMEVPGRPRQKPIGLRGRGPKLTCTPEEFFLSVCQEYGVNPDTVRNEPVRRGSKERLAVLKFAVETYRQKWNRKEFARIVNKNDSLLNHYLYVIYHEDKHLIGMA